MRWIRSFLRSFFLKIINLETVLSFILELGLALFIKLYYGTKNEIDIKQQYLIMIIDAISKTLGKKWTQEKPNRFDQLVKDTQDYAIQLSERYDFKLFELPEK